MNAARVFRYSFLLGLALSCLVVLAVTRSAFVPEARKAEDHTFKLAPYLFVRDQMQPGDLAEAKAAGFRTIIDLRPDGEATDQPTSDLMSAKARALDLKFDYVPTPHGDVPDEVVTRFSNALAQADGKVLLYCRSGNRAVRVWALAEASKPRGLDAEEIVIRSRRAGFDVTDLQSEVASRIARRALF